MQLLAGCTQPVREYILQHGGINQTFKECTDRGILFLKTMDQTHAIDRKRTEQEKSTLAIANLSQEPKPIRKKKESLKQTNERLAKEVDSLRLQFQNMPSPAKPKETRKAVNLTEKQKQDRAAKRKFQCTYCKRRGHVEAECNKKKKDQERSSAGHDQAPAVPQPEHPNTQHNVAAITIPPPPPPFLHSTPAQQYWDTQRFQPYTEPLNNSHPLYDFANFSTTSNTTNEGL